MYEGEEKGGREGGREEGREGEEEPSTQRRNLGVRNPSSAETRKKGDAANEAQRFPEITLQLGRDMAVNLHFGSAPFDNKFGVGSPTLSRRAENASVPLLPTLITSPLSGGPSTRATSLLIGGILQRVDLALLVFATEKLTFSKKRRHRVRPQNHAARHTTSQYSPSTWQMQTAWRRSGGLCIKSRRALYRAVYQTGSNSPLPPSLSQKILTQQ